MNTAAPTTSPENERRPPKNATISPNGETSPSAMPAASSTAPSAKRVIATALRPLRRARSSCAVSTEPPSACSGVTESTRRDPTHAAAHVVPATIAAGIRSEPCTTEYDTPSTPSQAPAAATQAAEKPVPTSRPSVAPMMPTRRPWRATSARCDLADAPTSRIRAMRRVRPATTVENVFAVTMAPT